jgi:hypothetical protein
MTNGTSRKRIPTHLLGHNIVKARDLFVVEIVANTSRQP